VHTDISAGLPDGIHICIPNIPILGRLLKALEWKMLVNFIAIWYFNGHLVYFVAISFVYFVATMYVYFVSILYTYILLFWYVVPRKIWHPCISAQFFVFEHL
jgi:hypothetical protein